MSQDFDAIVVGGGFYGASIALYLATERQLSRVLLLEQEPELMLRASRNNQARVHQGYHYPRSLKTAQSSRINFSQFVDEWDACIDRGFDKIYAVARVGSSTSPERFEAFCRRIGAPCKRAGPTVMRLFNPALVRAVFCTQEPAFDAQKLAERLALRLLRADVKVACETRALQFAKQGDDLIQVDVCGAGVENYSVSAPHVFNCTYSGLNQVTANLGDVHSQLKHELAQMALIQPPEPLQSYGITVIDGPFFSAMPYPQKGCHSLSHVRLTPERRWACVPGIDPYLVLADAPWASRAGAMLRDAARYVPMMGDSKVLGHVREVKTTLIKSSIDDSRPIQFDVSDRISGLYSILGGKLDNIYDVLQVLASMPLDTPRSNNRSIHYAKKLVQDALAP